MKIVTCSLRRKLVSTELSELMELCNELYNKLVFDEKLGELSRLPSIVISDLYPESTRLPRSCLEAILFECDYSKKLGETKVTRGGHGSLVFSINSKFIRYDNKRRPSLVYRFNKEFNEYFLKKYERLPGNLVVPILLNDDYNLNNLIKIRISAKMLMSDWKIIHVLKSECKNYIEAGGNILGIDLGLNNIATITCSNGNYRMIAGDYIDICYRNYYEVVNSEESTEADTALAYVKLNNRIHNYINNLISYICKFCVSNAVSEVILGYSNTPLDYSLLKNSKVKKRIKLFPEEIIVNKLCNTLKDYAIRLTKIEESFTSLASFFDKDVIPSYNGTKQWHRFSGKRLDGVYTMRDGIEIPADVNAGFNIIKKVYEDFYINLEDISGLKISSSELLLGNKQFL